MASKSSGKDKKTVAEEVREDSRRSSAGDDRPFADPKTNPESAREKSVQEAPAKSFDERTRVKTPVEQTQQDEE